MDQGPMLTHQQCPQPREITECDNTSRDKIRANYLPVGMAKIRIKI